MQRLEQGWNLLSPLQILTLSFRVVPHEKFKHSVSYADAKPSSPTNQANKTPIGHCPVVTLEAGYRAGSAGSLLGRARSQGRLGSSASWLVWLLS